MTKIILVVFIFCVAHASAQIKVQFILKEKTTIHHDSIFITGSFRNWDTTSNKNFLLHNLKANEKSIVLNIKPGEISYKFYRGSWLKVEKQYNGNDVSDRKIQISNDTTLIDSVLSWRDEALIDKKISLELRQPDSIKIQTLTTIATHYGSLIEYYNRDSALYYAQKALGLLQSMKSSGTTGTMPKDVYLRQLINVQHITAGLMYSLGNYSKALELGLDNLTIANELNDKLEIAKNLDNIIADYDNMKDYQRVLSYAQQMEAISLNANGNDTTPLQFFNRDGKHHIAYAYYKLGLTDSAWFYARSIADLKSQKNINYVNYIGIGLLGDIYNTKGNFDSAIFYYRQALPHFQKNKVIQRIGWLYTGLATLYKKENRLESALFYARAALNLFRNNRKAVEASWGDNSESYIADISPLLAEIYKASNRPDSAYKYLLLSVALKDSLYNSNRIREFQTLTFNEADRKQQLERQRIEEKKEYRTKLKFYGLILIITGALIVAFVLYRSNKHKQKSNNLLRVQKQEIEKTLGELKNTQAQLIQSEKMASLGELTAGIAHEIQNPLNFVNNFSDVNKELLEELKDEAEKGNMDEVKAIANDVIDNEEKISHHGKRADAIVKGMLQHSRVSSGKKEPTDINALADEYLRLSYLGLRAKDKRFNADFKTDFDETVGMVDIVPQDIGRVLLNLFNNAFYAVAERRKVEGVGYKPTVLITTTAFKPPLGGLGVSISVKDNGNGIPQNIVDKIFQPFFTTKPTGQGTGLGLSLSYDIIKAHGGDIRVETKESEGALFVLQLPFM